MQRTIILHGTVNRQYGKTMSEQINDIIEKHPEYKLVQAIVLESSEIFCTLLCVFEKIQEVIENENCNK